jgi:hypothetical protein
MIENNNIRLENVKKQLSMLAPSLTVEDKMKVALEMPCSVTTIDRYLKGEVKKIGFAEKLVGRLKRIAIAS